MLRPHHQGLPALHGMLGGFHEGGPGTVWNGLEQDDATRGQDAAGGVRGPAGSQSGLNLAPFFESLIIRLFFGAKSSRGHSSEIPRK